MKPLLLVGLGGAIGSVLRYKLSVWVMHYAQPTHFPAGTFAVNVLGCLVAGLLLGLAERRDAFGPDTRLLLFTGLLGGFTTFSAFGLETVQLLRRGETALAAVNVVFSVLCGLLALIVAMRLVPAAR